MKVRCMIVDDEPLAIELLETYIASVDDLDLVATCENALQAISEIRNRQIDLLFLDIQMPQLNGIEFLKTLKYRPKVIITSAYQEYAYDAFQIDAQDYLLKPITFEQFLRAINKAFDNSVFHRPGLQLENTQSVENFTYVKANRKMVKISLDQILYIESIRDSVKIVMTGSTIVAQQKISTMEDKLPGDLFLRIHRSFIVSMKKISAFSTSSIEVGEAEIPIGRSYKELVAQKLNESHE